MGSQPRAKDSQWLDELYSLSTGSGTAEGRIEGPGYETGYSTMVADMAQLKAETPTLLRPALREHNVEL